MVLSALKQTLEREGFHVVACASPLKALSILNERDFSVIISDQRMPEMLGLDFLIESRTIRPNASRILVTAVLALPTIVDAINTLRSEGVDLSHQAALFRAAYVSIPLQAELSKNGIAYQVFGVLKFYET